MPSNKPIASLRSALPKIAASLHSRRLAAALFAAALTSACSAVHATTRTVPGQFATIQAAINASSSGDTIDVAPGTYSAAGDFNLSIGAKNLTIESTGGAAVTILDNNGGTRSSQKQTITINGGQNLSTVLKGFTIQNSFHDIGGAVTIVDSHATIQQCVFVSNFADAEGGAIAVLSNGASSGAAITQCSFLGNSTGDFSTSSGFGGAIECIVNVTGPVQNVSITDCVFDSNTSTYDGGAVDAAGFNAASPMVSVINCTFDKNNASGFVAPDFVGIIPAPSAGSQPGAVSEFNGTATLTNSALNGDTSPTEVSTLSPGFTASFCDINQAGFAGVNNNINAAPNYIDASHANPALDNLHVQSNSPLISDGEAVGSAVATGGVVPSVDLNNLPRHATPDIGAFEVQDPTADPQTVSGPENTPIAVTLTGSDANTPARALTYSVTTPSNGALSGTAPNLTYTPAVNFVGTDSFTFRVNNGNYFSPAATVTINVTSSPPILSSLTANATVPSGENLTVQANLVNPAPAGGAAIAVNSNSASIENGVINIPAGQMTGSTDLLTHAVSADVAVTLTAPSGAGTITANVTVQTAFRFCVFHDPTVKGGSVTLLGVTLLGKAGPGGITLAISCSDTGMVPPGTTITVPAGANGRWMSVRATPVSSDTVVTATATLGSVTKSGSITVLAPVLTSLTPSATIAGGVPLSVQATLSSPAPAGGFAVPVSSDSAAISGAAITVPAGLTTASAVLITHPVSADTAVTLSAPSGAGTITANVTVQASFRFCVFHDASGFGGSATLLGVVLYGPAPAGGITLALSSSDTGMVPPGSHITVPAGAKSAWMRVTPSPVAVQTVVTATATLGSVTKSATFTVNP